MMGWKTRIRGGEARKLQGRVLCVERLHEKDGIVRRENWRQLRENKERGYCKTGREKRETPWKSQSVFRGGEKEDRLHETGKLAEESSFDDALPPLVRSWANLKDARTQVLCLPYPEDMFSVAAPRVEPAFVVPRRSCARVCHFRRLFPRKEEKEEGHRREMVRTRKSGKPKGRR